MASDASPYSTLQYLHSWAEPHLPPSVNYVANMGFKLLASLPPSVANIVPLAVGGIVAYWTVMAAFSTIRSTFRQSWFLLKWGTIAVVLAYGWSMLKGEQPMNAQQNPISSFLGGSGGNNPLTNGPLGGLVNQAAKYAGLNTNGNGITQDEVIKSAYNNLVPYPVRMMGNLFGMNPAAANKRDKKHKQGESQDDLVNTANVATEWLGGLFGKVSEALQEGKEDRWSESRQRRAAANR